MSSFAEFFIRRPVTTTLVMAAILIFGIISFQALPVNNLPNVDFPTILVTANLPGATPETMASAVATPLERQFTTIAGLESMSSSSALGYTQITLQFKLARNIDAAGQDVQAAIASAYNLLPPGMPSPPTYKKVNPASMPVMYLALSSPTLPIYQVDEYAETLVAQRLSMISGVAQVQVLAPQQFAVRVQLNPDKMAGLGIGIDQVQTAVQSGNVNLPTGTLYGRYQSSTVQANGQLYDASAYRQLVVNYRNGSPIRLSDIGDVVDSSLTDKCISWLGDKRAILLAVQRQPGSNTIQVTDEIKNVLPMLKDQMPAAVSMETLYDRSQTIRDSARDVEITLALTVVLVVFVIFLFLRNVSATIIPSLTLPFSIIGTFAVMHLLKFSIDNISLMALTLSVGFVVDDAIVVIENIVRHIEAGQSRIEAAIRGSKEIVFTILSMTISLVAVFIPIFFMSGIVGRLFNEFAVTMACAILISGFVSLSLTPMLCSRFLRTGEHKHANPFTLMCEKGFDLLNAGYERTLKVVLDHPNQTFAVFVVMTIFTGWLFVVIPKGFMPSEDTDQIFAITEADQDTSFRDMVRHQKQVNEVIAQDPNVDAFMSSAGAGGTGGSITSLTGNTGQLFIRLKPRAQRKLSADEIIEELHAKLIAIPGIRVYLQNPPSVQIGGQQTKSMYQVTLESPDTEKLFALGEALKDRMQKMPELQDVTTDVQVAGPQVNIDIDRDKASSLGVTVQQVEQALSGAYGSTYISTIYATTNEYRVVLEVEPRFQRDPQLLSKLYVTSSFGKLVPLNTVAKITPSVGPLLINHVGQLPSATISFNLAPGASLGTATEKVEHTIKEMLPENVGYQFQGSLSAFQSSLGNLWFLLIVAVLVIYIVLGVLYESFIHPITILAGLPPAALGALLTLALFHVDLNIYAFLGLILLIGIVKKNAIMMIDFAIDAQRRGAESGGTEGKPDARSAIYQACLIRFRPIMMTTMAAIMGAIPIAAGWGAGGEARQPLGLAVLGGLLVSQLLTLYFTPVFYVLLEKLSTEAKVKRLDKQLAT